MTTRQRFASLGQITRALSRGDDPSDVITVALGAVAAALEADVVSFGTLEEDSFTFIVYEGGQITSATSPVAERGLTETVLGSAQVLLVGDVSHCDLPVRRLLEEGSSKTRSYLGVPARDGDVVLGVFSVQAYEPDAFDEGDVSLVVDAGQLIADAITSSRRTAASLRQLDELGKDRRERSDFLVGVAHDMRSPLAGIVGFATILAEMEAVSSEPMAKEAVAFIASEADRLSDLVGELVDIGRVDLGETTLEFETFDIQRLIERAVESVARRYPSVTFVANGDRSVVISADMIRIHRVVVNLLENAVVHGPESGLVTIEANVDDVAATIMVTDRGRGIPIEHRDRIFERFARLDTTTVGSGVGLFLARGVVEAHGGTIHVEDAVGGGSCFVIRLPMGSSN